jgi:hypothetical protein
VHKNLRRIQRQPGPARSNVAHDDPDGPTAGIRRSFKDDGTYLVHEVNVSDKVRENLTPNEQPRGSLVGSDPLPFASQS